MKRTKLELKPWHRRLGYVVFALLAFVLALRQTLPAEAVRERLVMEAAAQGWQLSVDDVHPAGLVGVSLRGVRLESRDGIRVPVERIDATLRLLPLLLGRRGVGFDARVFDGRVTGFAEVRGSTRRLVAKVAGVDLSRAVPLRKATGLDLAGSTRGDVDVTLDEREPGRSTGHLAFFVDGAAVRGGQVPIPGMGGALTLPQVALGRITATAVAKDGRLSFEKLEVKGDDLEATGEGLYLVIQPRLSFAPIFGKAQLRIHDAFWSRSGAAALRGVVDMALARARGKDGAYGFQIFGTLSQPQARLGAAP